MNDLPFIFYDARKMYLDTSDMSIFTERAHRRLSDFTWFNDGPPLNDNDKLRQITHVEAKNWGKTKGELLAKGWIDGPTFFFHRGVIKSLNESKEKFVENYNKTATANKKPRLEISQPHSEHGCVTYNVTSTVTDGHLTLNIGHKQISNKASKPLTKNEKEIAQRMKDCLNSQWVNDAGKWINRIKADFKKCERVFSEVELAVKESRIKSSPAQYAEQIWKEFT
jgi:hypothetical protein